jgi:hypothetical protein
MNRNPILVALLAIFMVSATTLSVQAAEYFHADRKARLYNEISSFQAMRNDLILKKMNHRSGDYGFAVLFLDEKLDSKQNDKYFSRFIRRNPGKQNYFIIFVGSDMHAIYKFSSPAADRLAKKIVYRSTYGGNVLAGPLVYNTVETMKHR